MRFYNTNFARTAEVAKMIAYDMVRNPTFTGVFPILFVAKDGMMDCYERSDDPRGAPSEKGAYFVYRVEKDPLSTRLRSAHLARHMSARAESSFASAAL